MNEYQKLFNKLQIIEHELQKSLLDNGIVETFPKNTLLVEQDKYIKHLAIVIEGKVRVWQENEDKQILLYYVEPINTCVLSLSACFKDTKSCINAITEIDTTIIRIPVKNVKEWYLNYVSWQKFTTFSFIYGYDELLISFKKLAFNTINERLKDYLLVYSKKNQSNVIQMSHSQLANEIGTTREVVSKILKKFERDGFLYLQLKKIVLLK